MARISYPKNPYLKNGRLTELYLLLLRWRCRLPAKLLGLLMGCKIACDVPERLFLPHPIGVIAGQGCVIGNNVVLLQQVTLGVKFPYGRVMDEVRDPTLREGVYVGPGARILGPIIVGEWSVIGANAVITKTIPPYSIVVGHNKILEMKSDELEKRILAGTI